ncbi:MAG: GHKL domain-containing protein [Pseudobutyrivibrio sp.]|nr:GHKL domain-containing protein [Pseudobutyrivibrio sp.]
MPEYVTLISTILLAALHVLIVSKAMRVLLGTGERDFKSYVLWTCFFLFSVVSNYNQEMSNDLRLVGNILFMSLLAIGTRTAPLKIKIAFSLIMSSVLLLVEVITVLIIQAFHVQGEGPVGIASFLSKMIIIIGLVVLEKFKRKTYLIDISIRGFLLLSMIPLVSIYFIKEIIEIATKYPEYDGFAGITSGILLLINYVIFDVYDWLRKEAQLKANNKLFTQQLEMCSRQTAEQEAMYNELRRMRHDMKNHLAGILAMIDSKRVEEAHDYIEQLVDGGMITQSQEVSKSGHVVVDALVNNKYAIAKMNDIEFNSNIFIPNKLPFKNENLVIIIGNLLENAIEACKKVSRDRRFINLEINYEKSMLHICVKNSCIDEKREIIGGTISTTKSDKANHGMGILSMKQAANIYDGDVMFKDEKTEFIAVAVLYETE